jgi:RND family efflux transporter MFP subunit
MARHFGSGILFRVVAAALLLGTPIVAWTVRAWNPSATFPTIKVSTGDISRRTSLNGLVVPTKRSFVNATLSGRIREVRVRRGQIVSKGELLVTIDSPILERDVRRKQLALRRLEVRRHSADDSESNSATMELDLEQARLDLEDAIARADERFVRSPIAGTLVHLGVSAGDYVGVNTPVGIVGDSSAYAVEVEGDEMELLGIRQGQDALVVLRSESTPVRARVTDDPILRRVAQARAAANTYYMSVALLDALDRVTYGQSARVEVAVATRHRVPIVPISSVVQFNGEHYVVRVERGHLVPVKVQVGAIDDHSAEVISGVPIGAEVAVGSSEALRRAAFGRAATS